MKARRLLPIGLAVAMLLGPSAWAAERAKATEPAADLAELQARLAKILSDTHTPGMGVVIADRSGILWTAGIGVADVASGRPATAETLFRIASISKMFVGFAVLKLVEEKRLTLDAPVRGLVPDVPFTNRWEATNPVRVVHLLEHTTGWDSPHPKQFLNDDPRPLTLAEGLALGPESRVSRWRPGTRFAYTNSGPAVAAAVVEKLIGKRFEDYVKEAFFDPIGMPTAEYFDAPRTHALRATLYKSDGVTPLPSYRNHALRPAGAISASARDMGAALLFLLRGGQSTGGRLLSEASLRRMETPVTSYRAQGGLSIGYALCNDWLYDDHSFVWRGHAGATEGAGSQLYYRPEQGVGYFFAINSESGPAHWRLGQQLRAYLTKGAAPPSPPPAPPVASDIADAYTGWYFPANPQVDAIAWRDHILGLTRLRFQENELVIKPLLNPAVNARNVDGARFRNQHLTFPNIVLMNTPDGRVFAWNESVFVKISAVGAWAALALLVLLLAALVSVPLVALAGALRAILRRGRWAKLSTVTLVAWLGVVAGTLLARKVMSGDPDVPAKFGSPTVWSVAMIASSYLFAVASFAALLAGAWTWRRRKQTHPLIRHHDLAVALIFVATTLYLAWHGMIGYRTWA